MGKKLQNIYLTYYNLLIVQSYGWLISNLVINLSEGIHRIKCKYGHDDKNVKLVELHTKYTTVFLNT